MKKTFALILASMILAGASAAAFASEDFPPGYSAENGQAEAVQSTEPPVYSIEDYQDMNDDIASPSDRSGNIPAYGSRYGSDVRVAGTIPVEQQTQEEEAVATATADSSVPKDNASGASRADNSAANNATAGVGNTTTAAGETPENVNDIPDTGAANVAVPLVAAVAALGAVPFISRRKRK